MQYFRTCLLELVNSGSQSYCHHYSLSRSTEPFDAIDRLPNSYSAKAEIGFQIHRYWTGNCQWQWSAKIWNNELEFVSRSKEFLELLKASYRKQVPAIRLQKEVFRKISGSEHCSLLHQFTESFLMKTKHFEKFN